LILLAEKPLIMTRNLIEKTAHIILEGFDDYLLNFNLLTDRIPALFQSKAWNEIQQNHRLRLRLYKDQVSKTKNSLLKNDLVEFESFDFWKSAKSHYTLIIANKKDKELAETFFNSVIRKTYSGLAINEALMYVHEGYNSCKIYPNENLYHAIHPEWGLRKIIEKIMDDFDFGVPYMNKEEDIEYLIKAVKEVILTRYIPTENSYTQVLKSVFYRNKGAYVIGRINIGGKWMPFVIPFLNGPKGVFADTMIFDPNLMSGMFSFSRSYFMVKCDIPSQLISFLNAVIPNKKIHELYNAIGFNKHGKTEFYSDFINHLGQSRDNFVWQKVLGEWL
jgi:isocitrate dehydrogenase kinase/phosphatase